jgi:hypothetical protein
MTSRRTFLGAAAALEGLPATSATRSPTDHALVEPSDAPGRDYELPSHGGSIYVERYDDDADVTLRTTRQDPHVAASVYVSGEWGSASLSLGPKQAEALATALQAAADEWEGEER